MNPSTPLIAAWFVNPALLSGLGLAALPILIHLLSRRQFRRIEWGATRFLREAERENRRRLRFEQWVLMALRCLAMALLVLLVARPFVQPGMVASLLGGGGRAQRVIVIDDSASLSYRSGTSRDFDLLREAGLRLIGWLSEGAPDDPVTIYLTSRPSEPLVAGQRLSIAAREDLRARLERLEPSNLPARPRRMLEAIAADLPASGRSARADVYLLSDFQRSEWLVGGPDHSAGPVQDSITGPVFEPLARLDPGSVRVVLIATGVAARDNIAMLEARLERPQTVAGIPAVLNLTIANHSSAPLEGAQARVEIDGAPLPAAMVETIRAGESRKIPIEVTFPSDGFSQLVASVDAADGLPADNAHRMALAVKPALSVLLVDGEPSPDPVADEVYFLRNALAPAGPFSSGIRVQTVDPEEIEAVDLGSFDCVILCNVAPPPQGAVDALQRYVRGGGGLLVFLGEMVGDPDEYNRVFYAGGEGLLPLPLREIRRLGAAETASRRRAPEGDVAVGLTRAGPHPVTAMFPAGGDALSEYVRFRTYYRCGPPETAAGGGVTPGASTDVNSRQPADGRPPAVILAHFTDEARTPALIERPFGRGRVLLFTSSADLDWNDWARASDGSYVVTMLELVQYAAPRSRTRSSFVAGETLALSVLPEEYEPRGVFHAPDAIDEPAVEATVRGPLPAVGEPVVLEGPMATKPGTYTAELTRRGGGIELRPLCVNLDASEFDLTVARPHELDLALGNLPHDYIPAADAFRQGDEQARRELWPAILVALVSILMVEQTLAWWFGTPEHLARTRRRLAPLALRLGIETR